MSPGKFGRFELLEQIAVGGMAEIWLAVQTGPAGFAKRLVLKRILPHLARDPAFVQMFLDEARLAAQLSHPHIAQIIDFGEVDGAYYLAMELVRGPDLRRLLRACARGRIRVPVPVALRIMVQTCSALDFAHRACDPEGAPLNLIHRDVSPQNILVSLDGNARLVDFGIARAASQSHHTESGFVKGKFNYMAPEQLAGGAVDPRTDLFAAGLVLYELLTGKQAYEGEGQSVIARVLEARIAPVAELREDLPGEVRAALERALQKDPGARFPDAAALEAELERCLASMGQPTTAHDVARFLESVRLASGDPLHIPGDSSARNRPVAAAPSPGSGAGAAAPHGEGAAEARAEEIAATMLRPGPAGTPPPQDVATLHTPRPAAAQVDPGADEPTAVRAKSGATATAPASGPADESEPTDVRRRPPASRRLAVVLAGAAALAGAGALAWAFVDGDEADPADRSALSPLVPVAPAPPASPGPHQFAPPASDPADDVDEQPEPTQPGASPAEAAADQAAAPAPRPADPTAEPAGAAAATAQPKTGEATGAAHHAGKHGGPHAGAAAHASGGHAAAAQPAPQPAEDPGFLSLTSQPATTVEIDGARIGPTPLARQQLAPGVHRLRLTNPELGLERQLTVEIASGEERKEAVRFGKARITFLALPWAQITLGNRVLGQTPMAPQELYEGVYELRASNPESGNEVTRTLVVEPGRDATVKLDLRGEPL